MTDKVIAQRKDKIQGFMKEASLWHKKVGNPSLQVPAREREDDKEMEAVEVRATSKCDVEGRPLCAVGGPAPTRQGDGRCKQAAAAGVAWIAVTSQR